MSFLSLPIADTLRTTEFHKKLLKEMGIRNLGDLLQYFPRDYEDRTHIAHISELRADQKNVLRGKFIEIKKERTKFGKSIVRGILIEEESGNKLECVWFHAIAEKVIPVGTFVLVTGKAKYNRGKITLQSPEVEKIDPSAILNEEGGRIVPIYPEHGKLNSQWFAKKIQEVLSTMETRKENIPNLLPKEIRIQEELLSRTDALREIHSPSSFELLELAKKTFAFEELFFLQLVALKRKFFLQHESAIPSVPIPFDPEIIKRFFDTLPFTPTNAQKIALYEIVKDMEKNIPMQRLLEGDVGSGKTLVAILAALVAMEQGLQVALLAPTEILAQQHFQSIQKTLEMAVAKGFSFSLQKEKNPESEFFPEERVSPRVGLLTGSIKGKPREILFDHLRKGKIHLLVGTHAILEDSVVFHHLGLAIIDEQHRFGVRQREELIAKGNPHFLQMTATPIPRTLAIVAYGDQDLSVLTELPPGRKPIHTKVVPPSERTTVEHFIDLEIEKGRQVFVICPLIEESETLEVKAATEEFVRLEEHIFPKRRLALLHGRMKGQEKESIMAQFKNRDFDILVSTSVVEVGVDIPNATIMLIEGAERFGLSQLHQFRGRVGRGEYASYCFLFPSTANTNRLRAMEKTQNGFELAEIDLRLRGPGAVYGIRQSGLPDMKIANLTDGRIVVAARNAAEKFLTDYKLEDFSEISQEVQRREQEIAKVA
jgi:ATP-dependent DNA helicase RecG